MAATSELGTYIQHEVKVAGISNAFFNGVIAWLLGIDSFTPLGFAIFKGVWAGLLAAALTPPMLLLAAQED